MSDDNSYDVFVVGAGPAGAATAWQLAKNGVKVALIDRGSPVGSKNLSGGVLWGHDLDELLPNWWEEAPVERKIVSKKLGFLTEYDSMVADWHFNEWTEEPFMGFSVLRSSFDPWMVQKAEEAGVDFFPGINIDNLIINEGRIEGIVQDDDIFPCKVVIIADGVNSRLTLANGLRKAPKLDHYYLGIKEVVSLSEEIIRERFNLIENEGSAFEFIIGNTPHNIEAGGFMYTNKSTISLGIVVNLGTLPQGVHSYNIFEHFKQHPKIQRIVQGTERVEYGAHLIPDGGLKMNVPLFGDGYLVVGDAAGLCFSNGLIINGMGPAIRSGIEAAHTVTEALKKNDYSKKSLSLYKKRLEEGYIIKNLKKMNKAHKFKGNPRLYGAYPELIMGISSDLFAEKGEPRIGVLKIVRKNMKEKKVRLIRALRDVLKFRHL
ncbi:MAG: FAD-dependent oxidoreductase [Candidatus Kariarchaeaceae archaeon]